LGQPVNLVLHSLDITANGLWGGWFERSYMDVRVFNPLGPSNKNSITACYKKHENEKKRDG